MAPQPLRKLEFPANIHQIAWDIRRQALQHPDRDPIVPGAPRPKGKTAKKSKAKKRTATKTRARKTTRVRRK